MDIKQNRPATAADTKTTTQTQKSRDDSSLLYRMAVRTMLEDLGAVKKKSELIISPDKSATISVPASIPVPLPPTYLVSPEKTETAKMITPATKSTEEIKEATTEKEKALKIKEEKQKAKEEQKIAQKTAREIKIAEETKKKEAAKKLREEINQNLQQAQIDYEAGAYESVIELAQKILENESISWFLKFKVGRLIKNAAGGLHKKQINQTNETSMPPINAQKTTASPPPNLPTLPDLSKNEVAQTLPQENPVLGSKVISPLLTEIISEIPSEPEEESGSSILKNRRVLFFGASLALIIILVVFGWWFANKNTSPAIVSPLTTPIVSASPTPSQPAFFSLFSTDKQKIIELKNDNQSLKEILLILAKTEEPAGIFTALTIKNNEDKDLSLSEIAQKLNLEIFSMPTQACDQTAEDCAESKAIEDLLDTTSFSLFIYSQNSSSTDSFSPFIPASGETEGRIGLIISLKKQTSSTSAQSIENQLTKSLKDMEAFLPKEFSSFLLKNSVIPQTPVFSQTSYKNIVIRYLNFPAPDISLDYAIYNGKLIFSTSKESMLAIVDQFIEKNPQ